MTNLSEEKKVRMDRALSGQTNDRTKKADAILTELENCAADEQILLFEYLLINFNCLPENNEPVIQAGLTDAEWEMLGNNFATNIRHNLVDLFGAKLPSAELINSLWEEIFSWTDRKIKLYALTLLLYSPFVPIFSETEKVGMITLTEEKFSAVKAQMSETFKSIIMIKSCHFEGNLFDQAAALLFILENCRSVEERALAMNLMTEPIPPILSHSLDCWKVAYSEAEISQAEAGMERSKRQLSKILDHEFDQRSQQGSVLSHFLLSHTSTSERILLMSGVIVISLKKILNALGEVTDLKSMLADFKTHKCQQCDKTDCLAHPSKKR